MLVRHDKRRLPEIWHKHPRANPAGKIAAAINRVAHKRGLY